MSRKLLALIIFTSCLIAVLAIGIATALMMDDGTNQYSGARQAAARAALQGAELDNRGIDGIDHLGTVKFRAESVAADNSTDTTCNNEFRAKKDPNTPDSYHVTWSYRTLFGIRIGTSASHICRADN